MPTPRTVTEPLKSTYITNSFAVKLFEQSLPNLAYINPDYAYIITGWLVLLYVNPGGPFHAEYIIKVNIIIFKPITHYEDLNTVCVNQYGNILFILRLF